MNRQFKISQLLLICVIFAFVVGSLAIIIQHKNKDVKSETSPIVDQGPQKSGEVEEEEEEPDLPNQKHFIAAWDKSMDQLHIDTDVVFLGDSITYQSSFDLEFEDLAICNLGVSSDTIRAMNYRVGTLWTLKPEHVVLMIGTNSLKNDNIEKCIKDYGKLVDNIKAQSEFELYIMSVTPVSKSDSGNDDPSAETIMTFNEALKQIAEEKDAHYIDLFSEICDDEGYVRDRYTKDGLHLSEDAYEVWADLLRPYIDD